MIMTPGFASPLWFTGLAIGLIVQMKYPVDWDSFWYCLDPTFTPFTLTALLSGLLLIAPGHR